MCVKIKSKGNNWVDIHCVLRFSSSYKVEFSSANDF